ncbi:MAG TPA: hypothetical protein VJN93_02170 [Candidatus Acidoferrum sp.]|nr:hypothetical protein [Candidatus Acidoferrum sp.]
MSLPKQLVSPITLKAALSTLRALNIPFQGPFITPKEQRIYVVDDCILTEGEIVLLHKTGALTSENAARSLNDLRALQARRPPHLERVPERVPHDRRRADRIVLRLDVLVRLHMPEAERSQTHAFTTSVNAYGGQLESPFRLTVSQRITLVNPQTRKEVSCRVVRVESTAGGHYLISFEFCQPGSSFWPVGLLGSREVLQ